jgi:excisionase family DNA binding protein
MTPQITLPRTQDIEAATTAHRELAAYLATGLETKLVQLVDSDDRPHPIRLPMSALQLLSEILSELGDGNAVKIVPVRAELTTQEAADLLDVSRPYMVKLLETGKLAYHETGKHRRIRLNDLMAYKQVREERSTHAMESLAVEAQELRMGYEAKGP